MTEVIEKCQGESHEEFLKRLAVLAVGELSTKPLSWWYLSFADEHQFHGAVIVKAHGIITARLATANLGINPKGEVLGHCIDPEHGFNEEYSNKLLDKFEADAAFAATGGVVNPVTGERPTK